MKNKIACFLTIVAAVAGSLLIPMDADAESPKHIYRRVSPGVVFILAAGGSQKGRVGTGVIIQKDGLIITNAHILLRSGAGGLRPNISIYLKPRVLTGSSRRDLERGYKGRVLAHDVALDLALIQIDAGNRALSVVSFADAKTVSIGDQVYAIGHPEQGGLWSLTTGVISAYRQNSGGVPGKNLFQTDASINRGNSGGPLLNESGRMIGLNAIIARKAADGLAITDVNFSIRSDVVLTWLNGLGYAFKAPVEAGVQTQKTVSAAPKQKTMRPKPDESAKTDGIKAPEAVAKKTQPSVKPAPPKILTPENPYNMDRLIDDMQDMEDMMEEMKDSIRQVKEKTD